MLSNQKMLEIIDEYSIYLTQLSYMYVKDWSSAEDIVQETFITYFQRADAFDKNASLKTYLSKITIYKSVDYLRRIKTRSKTFLKLVRGQTKDSAPTTEAILLSRIEQTELFQHVLQLKIKYREVIVLYYYEQFSTVEIAKLLDTSESTIRSRLKRSRDLLKDILVTEEMEVFMHEGLPR